MRAPPGKRPLGLWPLVVAALWSAPAAAAGLAVDLELSAAYGFGERSAFGGLAGVTVGGRVWEAPQGEGALEAGFLAGYQAEPYALLQSWLGGARVSGATHRLEGLFLIGHGARLLASRRLLLGVHLFGGWTHVVLRGRLENAALGIGGSHSADAGRLTTGLSLALGVRVTSALSVTSRLLAPFPYATEVISYLIPSVGVSLRL